MRLPGFLDRFLTRRFGSYSIDDPRPIHASAPYTFYMPDPVEIAAVQPGDWVKALFRPHPENRKYDAERMWVKVTAIGAEGFTGMLDSAPFDMPQIMVGTEVFIPATHVIDIDWADGHARPSILRERTFWERCYVDDCVLRGASHVDYLYREAPEEMMEGDKDPDSGWRFRGTDEAIQADEKRGVTSSYIAIGKVLNADDRWLHLINEPEGSAFQWNEAFGEYRRVDEAN